MSNFTRISLEQAFTMLEQGQARLVDIRDPAAFAAGHVAEAFSLSNQTLPQFLREVDADTPVLVMCYHGHSSQGAAQYLASQGYSRVYSVDQGFEGWRRLYPFVTAS